MQPEQTFAFEWVTEKIDEYVLTRYTPYAFFHKESEMIIEVVQVAFGYRVTLRGLGDGGLEANWCAGKEYENILFLLECMAGYVLQDKRPPFQSRIKPYFRDPDFIKEIEPYRAAGVLDFPVSMYELLKIICPVGLQNILYNDSQE